MPVQCVDRRIRSVSPTSWHSTMHAKGWAEGVWHAKGYERRQMRHGTGRGEPTFRPTYRKDRPTPMAMPISTPANVTPRNVATHTAKSRMLLCGAATAPVKGAKTAEYKCGICSHGTFVDTCTGRGAESQYISTGQLPAHLGKEYGRLVIEEGDHTRDDDGALQQPQQQLASWTRPLSESQMLNVRWPKPLPFETCTSERGLHTQGWAARQMVHFTGLNRWAGRTAGGT